MSLSPAHARDILKSAELLCDAAQVMAAVSRIAGEMNAALTGDNPLVVIIMRGGVVFAGHLLPQLNFPLDVDSIDATRYGTATRGGEIRFRSMPVTDVAGRSVVLLDDILDEGITLRAIRDKLLSMGARTIKIAVLAEKRTGRAKSITADFTGLMLPDRYVFGFGMDVHGYWRNLPSIYAMMNDGQ